LLVQAKIEVSGGKLERRQGRSSGARLRKLPTVLCLSGGFGSGEGIGRKKRSMGGQATKQRLVFHPIKEELNHQVQADVLKKKTIFGKTWRNVGGDRVMIQKHGIPGELTRGIAFYNSRGGGYPVASECAHFTKGKQ